ncbi:MAG: hypothetical protein CMJ48_11350 [Planctomycetaceae bacterium]|nr:hypothetical protein [Planctomycetaceae bacterium]
MSYDHNECRSVLFESLLSALSAHANLIRELESEHRTEWRSGICALSYDILPWQAFIAIDFCTASDDYPAVKLTPADDCWSGYELIGVHNAEEQLTPAIDYVFNLHQTYPDSRELYHLIWMAAADALLDPKIAEVLRSAGLAVDAAADEMPDSSKITHVVTDMDRVFEGNYCEMIVAQRVMSRLLKDGI